MLSSKTSSIPISSPELFDHILYVHRRRRYKEAEDFLARLAMDSLTGRLSFIKRRFPRVLSLGVGCLDFHENLKREGHGDVHLSHLSVIPGDNLMSLVGGEEAFASQDLILSILNLQWANDLPGLLWQIKHMLKPDGLFIGSFLGGDTLKELKFAFMQAELELFGGASARVVPMSDLYTASQLLMRADFKLPVADRDVVTVEYPNLAKLMADLRSMGLTNIMKRRYPFFSSRRFFQRVEDIYREHFCSPDNFLQATFEFIYITGWSYHESQQKALKPGSAQVSLIEVIGQDLPAE